MSHLSNELRVDDERMGLAETGIYVRAKNSAGTWSPVDIAHLQRDSLLTWLRSREGLAENTVLVLLGWPAT